MPQLSLSPLLVVAGLVALRGCDDPETVERAARIGDIENGAGLIRAAGCGGCHKIPGIRDTQGLVGPPLDHMSRRGVIAGVLPNTPENLILWVRAPQEVVPGNAMPDTGLTEEQARDVTAYLYTLE